MNSDVIHSIDNYELWNIFRQVIFLIAWYWSHVTASGNKLVSTISDSRNDKTVQLMKCYLFSPEFL